MTKMTKITTVIDSMYIVYNIYYSICSTTCKKHNVLYRIMTKITKIILVIDSSILGVSNIVLIVQQHVPSTT